MRDSAAVAGRYLRGLAQAQDCTFASMATVVDASCPQQFQHFISNSPWDHKPVLAQVGRDADRLLGGQLSSCLIIDESSFAKQGDRSVGVARQWSGRLGKVDNCQVAVFGVLSDGQRHTPVDMRLYGELCGWTLARAHARSGDRIAIAAYLGASDTFDQAIIEFAAAYADQNEKDHDALVAAVASGRITAERDL